MDPIARIAPMSTHGVERDLDQCPITQRFERIRSISWTARRSQRSLKV
jgi:hypothetical protein